MHAVRGVPQDYAEAVKWYRKGADQGYARAQHNLGVVYAEGHGVPRITPKLRSGIAKRRPGLRSASAKSGLDVSKWSRDAA